MSEKNLTDLEKLLFDTLKDLVDAFPEGDDGIDLACGFGADGWLIAAKNLIFQIEQDYLDLESESTAAIRDLEKELAEEKRKLKKLIDMVARTGDQLNDFQETGDGSMGGF